MVSNIRIADPAAAGLGASLNTTPGCTAPSQPSDDVVAPVLALATMSSTPKSSGRDALTTPALPFPLPVPPKGAPSSSTA